MGDESSSTDGCRHCRPSAYQLFAKQMEVLDSPAGLLTAAVAMSMHELPEADPQEINRQLQKFADRVRQRTRSGEPEALLAHMHEVLFEEEGLRGADAEQYYDPRNSYLSAVLSERRGIPISLSLIYANVAGRLDLSVAGINAPAHFLVRVQSEGSPMYVDPYFGGRSMSRAEAAERIRHIVPGAGPQASYMLSEATHRQWIARMLNNLAAIFHQAGRANDIEAMMELRALL